MLAEIAARAVARRVFDCLERGDADGRFTGDAPGGKLWHSADRSTSRRDAPRRTCRGR